MDKATKTIAITANLSALRSLLESALQRATEAEDAAGQGEINQAIGAALGIDTILDEARALSVAILTLHRGRS